MLVNSRVLQGHLLSEAFEPYCIRVLNNPLSGAPHLEMLVLYAMGIDPSESCKQAWGQSQSKYPRCGPRHWRAGHFSVGVGTALCSQNTFIGSGAACT